MTVKGGHAVMLRVELTNALTNVAQYWVKQNEHIRSIVDKPHITICFVGRDLDESVGAEIMRAARGIPFPAKVRTTGMAMFGGKRDHMVVLVEKNEHLKEMRATVLERLKGAGIKPKSGFGFTPHITLAKGKQNDYPLRSYMGNQSLPVKGLEVKLGSDYHLV